MRSGVDDASVALTTDDRIGVFDGLHHVDLAHCACRVLSTPGFGYLAQGARGTHIAHGIAGGFAQDVIGDGHQGVFLSKPTSIFSHKSQPVYVRIDTNAEVAALLQHGLAEVFQMRGKRLGVVGKLARRIAVDFHHFAPHCFEEHRHNDSTAGVDGIHRHLESASTHRIRIDQGQGQGVLDVLLHPIGSSRDAANGIHIDIFR